MFLIIGIITINVVGLCSIILILDKIYKKLEILEKTLHHNI